MKKALLLSALLATVTSFASTKGYVEGYAENKAKLAKLAEGEKLNEKLKESAYASEYKLGVKTEVEVENSGLSFGGTLENRGTTSDFGLSIEKRIIGKDYNKVWIKYAFPTIKDVDTYVKGTLKLDKTVVLEGNAETKVNDVKVGLNAEHTFKLQNPATPELKVKGFAQSDISVIKDAKVELEVKNNFKEEKTGFVYLQGTLSGKYNEVKNLKLDGEAKLRYNFQPETYDSKNYTLSDKLEFTTDDLYDGVLGSGKFGHSYRVNAEYTGLKDTVIKGHARLGHANNEAANIVLLDGKADATYTGIKNTTLNANLEMLDVIVPVKADDKVKVNNMLLAKAEASAAYDYKVTDKFTVTPKVTLSGHVAKVTSEEMEALKGFEVKPSVKAVYNATDKLTLTGEVAAPVSFGKLTNELGYTQTGLNTKLNIKYSW